MNDLSRRDFLLAFGAGTLVAGPSSARPHPPSTPPMYGLIGKITARPGQRDDLIAVLLDGTAGMAGCLSYVVARDPADDDALWVTEVWESKASHEASLSSPSVRKAIERGRPMIAGFGPERFETEPVGGHGLVETE